MEQLVQLSYTILNLRTLDRDDALQKFATAINVQLMFENRQVIPYTPFNGFDSIAAQDKLFICGPSGCGKSKGIFECAKNNFTKFAKICIINPIQPVGEISGRITLLDLIEKLDKDDAIVWDNFPDDLVREGSGYCETSSSSD